MTTLRDKMETAITSNRKALADYNVTQDLLSNPALPIPPALPRQYRDEVLEARGQVDCPDCFASGLNLWNYQELEPCEHCSGAGVVSKIELTPVQYKTLQTIGNTDSRDYTTVKLFINIPVVKDVIEMGLAVLNGDDLALTSKGIIALRSASIKWYV